MLILDGSHGEGGGALVRTALALSTYTGTPFEVFNIRANRPQGGLKAQHLATIKALQQLCDAKTSEIQLGSTRFWYHPDTIKKGTFEIEIGTAGSISLLLQGLLLPALFAPGKVTFKIKGGTCGKWQASVDYIQQILFPHLQRFARLEMKIIKRGYYPQGGGEVLLEIHPTNKQPQPLLLTQQGHLEQIRGIINLSQELAEKEVGERIKKAAEESLRKYEVPINIRVEYVKTPSIGGECVLWAIFSQNQEPRTFLGGNALIEKNKSSEEIGKEAAEEIQKALDSEAAVDTHLCDQLIPFLGLLPGSEILVQDVSEHAKTNLHITEQFLPVKFVVEGFLERVVTPIGTSAKADVPKRFMGKKAYVLILRK